MLRHAEPLCPNPLRHPHRQGDTMEQSFLFMERAMDLDLEQLAEVVLRLPDAARADLATRLLASLEPDVAEDSAAAIAGAWDAELDRREAELEADPSAGIPAAEVFRVLEADLAAQRTARNESVD
jgi:putative addiction module component (TIGR02574 family)